VARAGDTKLTKKILQPKAFPSVFPGLPTYYEKTVPQSRSEATGFLARRSKQVEEMEKASEAFLAAGKVSTLQDLCYKLDRGCIPSDFYLIDRESDLLFIYVPREGKSGPKTLASLCVTENLDFEMWCQEVHLPLRQVAHITKSEKVSSADEILNLLSFLKSLSSIDVPWKDQIMQCAETLEALLPTLDGALQGQIAFFAEQLMLVLKEPKQRRYSSFLLATAAMWLNASTVLYKQLLRDNLFIVPCISHLKRLMSAMTLETGLTNSTIAYLKTRIKSLESREKNVAIIMDKIYSAKRAEFSGGTFYGVELGEPTKTMLCVMIKSVAGKSKDMVAMMPLVKIDSKILDCLVKQVLVAVQSVGFKVVALLTDAHSSNRKLYADELCNGKLQFSIPNPANESSRIFLLFDPVHIYKNFFNNLLNRGAFVCPTFQDNACSPRFEHVKQLYQKELGKPVKIAHKLTEKVLAPKPIERCNVMLSERFFHESTINGLHHYSAEHPEWKETAEFLQIIRTWWNIVNVRSISIGYRKREPMKKPIREANCPQIEFLQEFVVWLSDWYNKAVNKKKDTLSRETYLAAHQTSGALPELVKCLLQEEDISFILLGQISSDSIERRFGQYRQMAGGNFFISVRQILESEKAIRIKCLVKFSQVTLSEIKDIFQSDNEEKMRNVEENAALLMDTVLSSTMPECTLQGDEAVIYYIAGYISRSRLKRTPCQGCQALLTKSTETETLAVNFVQEQETTQEQLQLKESFQNAINRGGLLKPSDLVYVSCMSAFSLHQEVFGKEDVKKQFMGFQNAREVFAQVALCKMQNYPDTEEVIMQKCSEGHCFELRFQNIVRQFFNCMSKNVVSEINDVIHENRKRMPKESGKNEQKVKKLRSEK
jgi:hypothetical protein